MSGDPRKPIHRHEGDAADHVRNVIHAHLMVCTAAGAAELGTSGASFVTMGVGIWAAELAELDAKATRNFLYAIGDILDPGATHAKKAAAERRRHKAAKRLLAAVDLEMAVPAGSG